jgi:predicted RNA-binding Zn-ribbon protein involved in translation (DUF1610 family)
LRRPIPVTEARASERDLEAALAGGLAAEPTVERLTISCSSCGAQSTLAAGVAGDRCPFCGTAFVATASSTRSLKPQWLLPFRIGLEEARTRFRAWVHSLWFAPNRLAREASAGRLDGMYVPYWTFDAATTSQYTGQRGDDHTESEEYTALGGACDDSAVAVMVDVNKQVIFARRADGSFIARQIVAISEDDRLVFFPVYPLAASKAVKDAFYEYDVSLAAALGLPPFRGPSEKEYTIARVLAWYFYDDGLWDRFIDDDGLREG